MRSKGALQFLAALFSIKELLDCDKRQEVRRCHGSHAASPLCLLLSFWSNEYSISRHKVKGFQIESAAENRCLLHSHVFLSSAETQKPLFVISPTLIQREE